MPRNKKAASERRTVRVAEVGDVFAVPLPDGRFGAVQVIGRAPDDDDDHVDLATLDGIWKAVPTEAQARAARIFRAGAEADKVDRVLVPVEVPWWARFVAKLAPVEQFASSSNAWGGWYGRAAFSAWQGALGGVDEGERLARDRVRRGERYQEIGIDLGAGPARVRNDTWRISLGESGAIKVPARGVKWSALDVLALRELSYAGSDPDFESYVRTRRKLTTVSWSHHRRKRIDLRDTFLDELRIVAERGPLRIVLPHHVAELSLSGTLGEVSVDAERVGYPFTLHVGGPELPQAVRGLEPLQQLTSWGLRRVDVSRLVPYSALRAVTLRGAPGSITNVESFAKLCRLEDLVVHELYDLDGLAFPDASAMVALRKLEVRGISKEAASTLAKKMRVVTTRIVGVRTKAWIEANVENPFRDWDQEDPKLGKAACAAWKKAAAAAAKAGRAASLDHATSILRALVDAMNRVHDKHTLDTIRREEAFEAFMTLASRFDAVVATDAEAWFGRWRDF